MADKPRGLTGSYTRIYRRINAPLPKIVQCLRALGRAREMLTNYGDVYETFDDHMRDQCGNAFVWSFFQLRRRENVEQLLSFFSDRLWNPVQLSFAIFYNMITVKLEAAKKLLNLGYQHLASIRSVIGCGNQHDVSEYLTDLLMKESGEMLSFLRSKSKDVLERLTLGTLGRLILRAVCLLGSEF